MKRSRLLYLLFLTLLLSSCKKLVEQVELNQLTKIITSGSWAVTHYLNNGTDITPAFRGYSFYFKDNGTVSGVYYGITIDGTWSGDISTKTITSNFPGASDPVNKLNTVWTIKDSYEDSVSAVGNINGNQNRLELKKQ